MKPYTILILFAVCRRPDDVHITIIIDLLAMGWTLIIYRPNIHSYKQSESLYK